MIGKSTAMTAVASGPARAKLSGGNRGAGARQPSNSRRSTRRLAATLAMARATTTRGVTQRRGSPHKGTGQRAQRTRGKRVPAKQNKNENQTRRIDDLPLAYAQGSLRRKVASAGSRPLTTRVCDRRVPRWWENRDRGTDYTTVRRAPVVGDGGPRSTRFLTMRRNVDARTWRQFWMKVRIGADGGAARGLSSPRRAMQLHKHVPRTVDKGAMRCRHGCGEWRWIVRARRLVAHAHAMALRSAMGDDWQCERDGGLTI